MSEAEFPLDSYKDAARHMRRPFTPEAVKFKVQATWPKDKPTGGLIVSYIDARLAVERLNLLVPHLWHDAYRPVGNCQMWCDLTVDGITRSDIGEGDGKGLPSDALKRAAVKFGIGVPLYAVPKMMLNAKDGHLKEARTRDGLTLVLTPGGEQHVTKLYADWLEKHGRQAFGDPLDHGDVAGAQGDIEDPADQHPEPGSSEVPTPKPAPANSAESLELRRLSKRVLDEKVWTGDQLKAQLVAYGASDTSSVNKAISTLQLDAVRAMVEAIERVLSEAAESAPMPGAA